MEKIMNLREALAKVRNAGYNPQINENIEYVDPESNYGNPFLDEYGDPAIDELKAADIKQLSDEDRPLRPACPQPTTGCRNSIGHSRTNPR